MFFLQDIYTSLRHTTIITTASFSLNIIWEKENVLKVSGEDFLSLSLSVVYMIELFIGTIS